MLGAILGDIVGSPYEFDSNNIKTTEFPLFSEGSRFTDDTVLTVAVAAAIMNAEKDARSLEDTLVESLRHYGRLYPDAGYGSRFQVWLESEKPKPYDSFGNGSAMRVSPVAWAFNTLEDVELAASISAGVSHDHPEGIKGAQATAAAIFMGRKGSSRQEIKSYMEDTYGYDLDRTLAEIRPTYKHVESCQETVPEAIIAFLESEGFEDAIRKAVSLGGDSDTLAAITGSIAEAYYCIPEHLKREALGRLDDTLLEVVTEWRKKVSTVRSGLYEDPREILDDYLHEDLIQGISPPSDREALKKKIKSVNPLAMWSLAFGDQNKAVKGELPVGAAGIATRDSWKIKPMAKKQACFRLNLRLSDDEFNILSQGHIPQEMEDHWFMYYDERSLRFYRSWTGICVFIADVEERAKGYEITTCLVNKDPEQGGSMSYEQDRILLEILILSGLGKDVSRLWEAFFQAEMQLI